MKNIFILLLCFAFVQLKAQTKIPHRCQSKEFFIEQMKNEAFQLKQKQIQKSLQQSIQNKKTQKAVTCNNPIIIPVAVHYNGDISTADVACLINSAKAQIATMNEDFGAYNPDISLFCHYSSACPTQYNAAALASNGTCIQFCLADQNLPTGEDNIGGYGITVGDYFWNSDADAPKWAGFLNIFVYLDPDGSLGVAPYAGASNPNGNGVFITNTAFGGKDMPQGCFSGAQIGGGAPYNLGRTGTHEAGHYFALDHVFEDYYYTGQCGASDFFDPTMDDTPDQNIENYGAPTINYANCSSTSENSCNEADFFFNFMDYVNDASMMMFTESQALVMQSLAEPQSKWKTNSISCYTEYQNGNISYEPLFENGCTNTCFDVRYTGNDGFRIALFLEGFKSGTAQTNTLNTKALIPNLQPYNYAPFNYDGTEYLKNIPSNAVDWVYIEALDNAQNIVAARAALLTTSGQIIDIDGNNAVHFPCLSNGNSYTLAVYHKSHLGVVASTAISYPASSTYNFSTSQSKAMGFEQLKNVGGVFCLYAGDFTGNGIINNLDYNQWASASAVLNQYLTWDTDGNGIINNLDYNLWQNNRSKVGESIIQK